MASVADPIPHKCANCHRQLGLAVKVVPHFTRDADAEAQPAGEGGPGEGKCEAWCPVCFVKCRAPKEKHFRGKSGRYAPDFSTGHRHAVHGRAPAMMRAIKCLVCGNESLSQGHLGCMQCPLPVGNARPHQNFLVLTDTHYAAILAGAKDPLLAGGLKPSGAPPKA